jgi:uncharacterized membrane protein YfcA
MLNHILPVGSLVVFCLAILAGSFTNGLVGLAFSAVSGGIVFWVLPPSSAVAVMAVGGLLLQVCNNIDYFKNVSWRNITFYIFPGFVGIPIGVHLLTVLPKVIVSLVFGLVLLLFVAWTLRKKPTENNFAGRKGEVIVGFIGGVLSGMLALPGIPVVIWSNVRGYGKEKQRGLSVPFNFAMLLVTVALTGLKGNYADPTTQAQLFFAVPVALVGWSLGVRCFKKISEASFRRFVMFVLLCSSLALIIPSTKSLLARSNQQHAAQKAPAKSAV